MLPGVLCLHTEEEGEGECQSSSSLAVYSCHQTDTGSHRSCELTPALYLCPLRRTSWACLCSVWSSFSQRRRCSELSRSHSSSEQDCGQCLWLPGGAGRSQGPW